MDQDDKNQNQPRQPQIIPKRPIVREMPLRQHTTQQRVGGSNAQANESAANILRSTIDEIYKNDPNAQMSTTQSNAPSEKPPIHASQVQPTQITPTEPRTSIESAQPPVVRQATQQTAPSDNQYYQADLAADPYEKTHSKDNLQANADAWKEYHSAWQNYYQQYFYRHYANHLQQKDTELRAERDRQSSSVTDPSGVQGSVSENEALNSLRTELRTKIRNSGQKARRSRHFMPVAAAISVMLIFSFLQYNTQIVGFFANFVSPGNVTPDNIIVDESIDVPVGPEPKLIIPKINVNVPIVYDVSNDPDSQLEAMKKGVAWFGIPGASSKPGQVGNTVLSGHSTNNLLETGDNKFVFLHLPELKKGDTIYSNHNGVRYTYKVTKTEVVMPTDVNALVYKTDIPVMTLITCVPIGTAEKRLLVTAEQISPSPDEAQTKPTSQDKPEPAQITGNSPSLLERIFGN